METLITFCRDMDVQRSEGQSEAEIEQLLPLVYDELRSVADLYFRRQPPGFTMRPTDIVHEACLHLIQHSRIDWTSTQHFRAIATRKMWQVIVDHLKQRHAKKRGGGRAMISLDFASDKSPYSIEPAIHLTPEQIYNQRWASTLLNQVLSRLEREYTERSKYAQFSGEIA